MGDSVARRFRSPTGQMFPPTTAAAEIVAELHRAKGKGTGQRHGQERAGEQRTAEPEGAPQNVLNFGPHRIRFLSDFMLHIGALSALAPWGSDLTAEN